MVFYYLNPFWYLHTLIRFTEPSFLQVNNLNSPSLSLYDTSSILLIIFTTFHWTYSCMGMYFLCWGAQNWTQIWRERKNYLLWPTGNDGMLLAAFSAIAHCWFTVNILPSRSLGSFSVKLLPRLLCVLVHRVNPQLLQDLAFPFVEFYEVQEQDLAHFLSLLISLWMSAHTSGLIHSSQPSTVWVFAVGALSQLHPV